MVNTGVFATKEELADLRRLARSGWVVGDVMIASEGYSRDSRTIDARRACHQVALSHGLPEIPGYYDITEGGEFFRF